jgi:hypothetical protein
MILLSRDRSKDAALEWAKSFNQPWPLILQEDTDAETLLAPYFNGGIGLPSYILVDREGKEVARGKAAALAAAKNAQP